MPAKHGKNPDRRVIWRGRQWKVTAHGIECSERTYAIPRDRLGEPWWLEHMAEKEWVDLDDLAEALRIARSL
jgi:hypothetical protein